MNNTYSRIFLHVVFGTKGRKPLIRSEIRKRLWDYLRGIAEKNGIQVLGIGGRSDHIHILLCIPTSMPVSKAVQLIKGGSSKWMNDEFFPARRFAWQRGYGAFSVSDARIPSVMSYIRNQEDHHANKTFRQEYQEFLRKHRIEYNENHLFG